MNTPTLIRDPWRRAWHFFSGDPFLTIVLSFSALLFLAAAVLPQTPQNDPIAYSRWLSETQQRFGTWHSLFTTLGLFSVFNSILFRLALALIGLICALRLIDQIDQLRGRRALPDRPIRPLTDQRLELNLDQVRAKLRGYRIQSNDTGLVVDQLPRSAIAAFAVYGGALIILIGLIIGTFSDYRFDQIDVEPNQVMAINSTPYSIRLDSFTPLFDQVNLTLLKQDIPIASSNLDSTNSAFSFKPTVYLENIGPALIVSAIDQSGKSVGLQRTADSPPQAQKFISFSHDRSEGFIAAPDAGIVLQIDSIDQSSTPNYSIQAYQVATGRVLTSTQVKPGETLTVNQITFTFQPAAFVTISLVDQPSHYLIGFGFVSILLGLIGSLIWPTRRVWLQSEDQYTRVISNDPNFDPARLGTLWNATHLSGWIAFAFWLGVTVVFVVLTFIAYKHNASLAAVSPALIGAWLSCSGSMIAKRRAQIALIGISLVLIVIALLL